MRRGAHAVKNFGRNRPAKAALFCFFITITSCGGGSDTPASTVSTATPTPPANSGPTWTAGAYESSSNFENRCETVRTGVDIEGNPFPDMSGSTLEENFWLRSWTHETYLWNDEVVDQNPANFNDPVAYFGVLKTNATTASGAPKDQFHFSQPTAEFLALRNSAPSAGYGAELIAYSTVPPRDFRVLYTEPGSPAADTVMGQPNLERGTRILEVDGVDLVNANTQAEVDSLNAGLFPASSGEMHTFLVEDDGAATTRTIMMISADVAQESVNTTKIINTGSGDVGYILLNTFSPFAAEEDIADAITAMKAAGISDLVIDLRYNGGGLVAIASQLSYMIAGAAQTSGKVFEGFEFNADAGNRNPVTGGLNTPFPFFDTGLGFSLADGTVLDTLDLSRVFILTTGDTCSASESVINALEGIDVDVILIGDTTCGKPYGFYPQDNCGETYFTIQYRGVNDKGFGDYPDGFIAANSNETYGERIAGCAANDDLSRELGDENEALLAAALQYRTSATCPTPPPVSVASSAITVQSVNEKSVGGGARDVFSTNRDVTVPN